MAPGRFTSSDRHDERQTTTFSVVMVTFARDAIVAHTASHVRQLINDRRDIEFILVDNNPDEIVRTAITDGFTRASCLKIGANKGVSARNDGAQVAQGDIIVFVDDDSYLNPHDSFDRLQRIFARNPQVGIVTARSIDAEIGNTPRASFPHTDMSRPKDRPFKTFRFQGNGFAIRREVLKTVGPLSEDVFYGRPEKDYAYRIIRAGFEILYSPEVWVVEFNDPGGRAPRQIVEEMRLTDRMIISWKFMPTIFLPLNIAAVTASVVLLNRGRINPLRAFRNFLSWVRRNPGSRTPIGEREKAYIRSCGGHVWR